MSKKRILIIDESGFSRICAALLNSEGYGTETIMDVSNLKSSLDSNEFELIIASYPYSIFSLDEIKKRNIPTIILSDQLNKDLIDILKGFYNSCCMIKPLDYQRFRYLVKNLLDGSLDIRDEHNIF